MAIPDALRRTSYRALESRYRVTALVPGKSFEVALVDVSAKTRTEVEATPAGARIVRTATTTLGLLRAWSADALNNPHAHAALRKREDADNRRLRDILEAAPPQ